MAERVQRLVVMAQAHQLLCFGRVSLDAPVPGAPSVPRPLLKDGSPVQPPANAIPAKVSFKAAEITPVMFFTGKWARRLDSCPGRRPPPAARVRIPLSSSAPPAFVSRSGATRGARALCDGAPHGRAVVPPRVRECGRGGGLHGAPAGLQGHVGRQAPGVAARARAPAHTQRGPRCPGRV